MVLRKLDKHIGGNVFIYRMQYTKNSKLAILPRYKSFLGGKIESIFKTLGWKNIS